MTNIPARATALIGRENELAAAMDLVRARRIVTLTGPGGIGKTGLAIEVARQLLPEFADDVWLVDLAPLTSADAVAPTIAAALGLGLDKTAVSPDQIAAALGSRHMLLVLDHCEHVILAAARLAEALLRTNPAIHVLATSHQPLRVEDERVCPVPPLAVPPAGATNRHDTLQLGAVKLFFARLQTANPGITRDARMAALGGAICRRLDGIPLAIELAASRAATQGVADVAAQLDDYFKQLLGSRRTPLPRHKTLRAILDWRYGMLSAAERVTLLHIAIFDRPFSLDDARAVVSGAEPDVRDTVLALVATSLVARQTDGATIRYRLLGPIRAYSLEKLLESGEQDRVAQAYAGFASKARPDICHEMPPCMLGPDPTAGTGDEGTDGHSRSRRSWTGQPPRELAGVTATATTIHESILCRDRRMMIEAYDECVDAGRGRHDIGRMTFSGDPVIGDLARAVVQAEHLDGALDQRYTKSVAIVAGIGRSSGPSSNAQRSRTCGLPKWRLKRAVDFVDANLGELIGLTEMAASAGLSRMHFAAQFRVATGTRPHEYLLRKRTERAQALLSGSTLPLVDIALEVGFKSQSHFTTVFTRFVGKPPRAWRHQTLAIPAHDPAPHRAGNHSIGPRDSPQAQVTQIAN